jgi:tetratricopeptide (TPR) repeat protein
VWIQRFRSTAQEPAYVNQILQERDRGRTGLRSRTSIRLSDLSVMRIGWQSEFEIQPLVESKAESEFSLFRGLLYLLNRDRPGKHTFRTPTATAATRGTEFTLEVEDITGRTILTVLEGEAELSNAGGSVQLARGEQGIAVLGQAPTKTAVIDTTNVVQWCLYYPGVLELSELGLTAVEEAALNDSLSAYRSGDLLRAVSSYPAPRNAASDAEKIYVAALLLSVGQVTQTEAMLDTLAAGAPDARAQRLAGALRRVIAAVKLREPPSRYPSELSGLLATEALAESYYQQSISALGGALKAARVSVERSPRFAFGWARVAELEFSHGNTKAALAALQKSLALAPRNAQALTLKGFLLSAQNRISEASGFFDQALAIDGGLGNAWLGRGLCRIRRGDTEEGRFDLQVAATSEPHRSLLRSYLGKAFSNAGDSVRAEKELELARLLDEGDPTPWLYSALLLQQRNRINEAVDDLERSQTLNDNRRVYRSRLLLDQDRAVGGANLANIYRDANLVDVSVREAGRAVNADYANYSAHLFLANSFNELRDPKQVNLRYETAWFTEYLVANLLAPVGAGTLSQTVSQQEYSKLLERDRVGITSSTDYLSHGEWYQRAAQYGIYGNSSYAAEVFYHSDNGQRPNNDLEQLSTVLNLKQQLSPQDSVYVRASYYDSEYGDVFPYYSQEEANPRLRTQERHEPLLLAGYHHEWSPGHHTMALAGRLASVFLVENPFHTVPLYNHGFPLISPIIFDQQYRGELEIYSGEIQQIWQKADNTLIVGGRFQAGEFDTKSLLTNGLIFDVPPVQRTQEDFLRVSAYAYDQWQIWPALLAIAGVSYDRVTFPLNYRYAPITPGEETRDQVSPKGGLIWTPGRAVTVRAAYTRGLSGASLDQSVRLEPSQVAGFNQAFRSVIPEAVAGANAAATFDAWSVSLQQKLGRGTFLSLSGEILSSEVDRTVGLVDFVVPTSIGTGFSVGSTREQLDYRERSLIATLHQLLGDEWSFGARYRLSQSELEDVFPDIPSAVLALGGFQRQRDLEATLHQLHLFTIFNHPSGFFAGSSAVWTSQSNKGYTPDRPGDDFWQFNVEAGYRFARRRVEVRLALLNITDQDYKLNPLNLTTELPRDRTLAASLRFSF